MIIPLTILIKRLQNKKIPRMKKHSALGGRTDSWTKSIICINKHRPVFKMLYLAMKDITKKWTGRRQDWSRIYAQLVIYYGDRIPE